ncbi:hypothetical protein, partial [Anaerofustis sp.]|uniref:hypothetical protein n=1 Tax=Anaerofustis sp. TaxID=1872517 RepID=UPI0025C2C7D6
EMNSRIPQYGKGRVSVGDLRNVGQYANVNARGGIELKPQIRRSAEEREKIHNSTQAVINSAKPVNSRSTYGEMNNRIPQYGKGRVSENDLRNVGQYANVDARGGIKIKPQIRRSAEEREKIHNSTQSIINNAKPVNSRSTYGEMNSRIPHYGKGRVSVGDLRNVGQYANVNARGGIELKPQIRRSAEERGNIQKTTNDIMDKYYTPYGKFNKENTYGNMEKARKEYVSFETKEKNLSNQEQEINKDKNKDYYIEKADKVSSDNNMAGLYFDKNPLKSFEEDSKYNKTKNEEDKKNYDYMTKEEKENAKYLLGKYGAEAQAEYLRDLVPRLNQRAGIAYMERELEDASPGRLKWESFKAGVGEKVKNTFQAGSVMGGNDEVFTPSAFEIAMDYLEENSDPETQKLIEDWKDRGDMTVSFAADLISPYLGIGLDSASEYGKSYTENLNNNANNPNMEKVKQSALKDAIVNTSINTALGMPNDMLKKAIGKDVKKVLNKHIKNDKGIKVISGLYNYLYDDRMNKEKKSWEKDNKKDDSFY